MRINKYLSEKGIASRREADEMIRRGKVWINGRRAVLGDQALEGDKVEVKDKKKLVYLAFNKPVGIATHGSSESEKDIADIFDFSPKVFPIGRLDKKSKGLIILTNDGRITDRLLNPGRSHEKEYAVKVGERIRDRFLRKMAEGVKLDDGYVTKECSVRKTGDYSFSIVLTEGKKRQIRRMCAVLGYSVLDLERRRIMNIRLGKIKAGEAREIKEGELSKFLAGLGLVTQL